MQTISPPQHPTALKEVVASLRQLSPRSRGEMLRDIEALLDGSIVTIIDTHNTNSVIFIFALQQQKFLLKAEQGQLNATTKEADWYEKVSAYNSPAPTCFAAFKSENFAFLLLEYIEGSATLDERVAENAITTDNLNNFLGLALFKNEQLFNQSKPETADIEAMETLFLKKYKKRRSEAAKFPYLKELFETSDIIVNGIRLHSPDYYLEMIRNDAGLHAYLTPERFGLIHGDLHCGNILLKNQELYFVDPNGSLQMPLEYDYGKILHSIHGGYGSIMCEDYKLNRENSHNYHFEVSIPDAYTSAFTAFKKQMTDQQFLRGLYAEAMHFATLLPHHGIRQEETTALFIRCIQIFNQLFYYLDRK